jgi:hypothetical protein
MQEFEIILFQTQSLLILYFMNILKHFANLRQSACVLFEFYIKLKSN